MAQSMHQSMMGMFQNQKLNARQMEALADIAEKYDSIRLLKLIEKYVLKPMESHYPYHAVKEEMRSMLNFSQGEDMTLGMYYEKFNTRVAFAESAGCTFMTETLLDTET